MRIAFFTDAFLPQTNGVVTHIINAANVLAETNDVLIVAPKPKRITTNSLLSKKIKLLYIPSSPLQLYDHLRVTLPYDPLVINKVGKFNPDIVHFHTPFTVGLNGVAYAKTNGVPLVGTFHTYFMEPEYLKVLHFDKIGLHKSKSVNFVLWSYSNFVYSKCDLVITPSKKTARDIKKHGITQPVEVISNGIDLQLFDQKIIPQKTKKSAKWRSEPYFIYVGRISKEKSIDVILRAFKAAFDHDVVSPHLVIVGEGPILKHLVAESKSLNIAKRVHFLGAMSYDKLIESHIYQHACCFISASKSETQGITFLEAMAAGLPLIGVSAKAVPEVISNNGILCKPDHVQDLAKAMKLIASDKTLRNKMSEYSMLHAKNHSIHETAEQLEKVYADLVADNQKN